MKDESDDALAQTLFSGVIEQGDRDLPRHKYLDNETEARMALVRLLIRAPKASLSHSLRLQLAEHFHPSANTPRLITFKFRKKGGRPDFPAREQIADDLATLKRCGARGEIKILQLSPRRIGVRLSTLNAWLDSRAAG